VHGIIHPVFEIGYDLLIKQGFESFGITNRIEGTERNLLLQEIQAAPLEFAQQVIDLGYAFEAPLFKLLANLAQLRIQLIQGFEITLKHFASRRKLLLELFQYGDRGLHG